MNNYFFGVKRPPAAHRRGKIVVLTAFLLVFLIGMVAFGVDTGYMFFERTRTQTAVDAAVLAGSNVMAEGGDENAVRDVVSEYLSANGVDADAISGEDYVITFGTWNIETGEFLETAYEDADTMRLFVRPTPKPMFFARVFGHNTFRPWARATGGFGRGATQDVVVVIDCSTSMSSNNRMDYTIDAANVLLGELEEDDRVSMVVYSWKDPLARNRKTGHVESSLDFDINPTQLIVDVLEPGYHTSGTNIAGGMRAALDEHRAHPRVLQAGDPPVEKVMVLMTDGQANIAEPPGTDAWKSIEHYTEVARKENVVIHAITLGSNASQNAMRDAATHTGGTYHHIEDGDYTALEELFRRLGQGIARAPRLLE